MSAEEPPDHVHNGANESAYPSFAEINGKEVVGGNGMTMREWYAGQALMGLMANSDLADMMSKTGVATYKMAEICFMMADGMIHVGRKPIRRTKE